MENIIYCSGCEHEVNKTNSVLTESGGRVCDQCLCFLDMKAMDENGKIILYLKIMKDNEESKGIIFNYPGSLSFDVEKMKTYASKNPRTVVWFTDHRGFKWWGINYKNDEQFVQCKRIQSSLHS